MKRLLTFCVLVAFETSSIVHGEHPTTPTETVRADTQVSDSSDGSNVSEKARRRWRKFSSTRLEKTLNSPKEKARNRALLDINRLYWDHPEVPGLLISAISKEVTSGDPRVSTLSMVQTLAQFHTPPVKQALLTWLSDDLKRAQASEFTFEILLALRNFHDDEIHDAVEPLLKHDDPRVVMLSADFLSTQGYQQALEPIQSLANHAAFARRYGFRACVFEAVANYKRPETIDFFVYQLPRIDGQLKYFAVDRLSRATGQRWGGNTQAWMSWWDTAQDRYDYPDKLASGSNDYAWDYPLPIFYSNRIYAKRMAFVIDISSTMGRRVSGGETRLERAKKELGAAISRLPPGAYFSIIAFDRKVRPLHQALVQATPGNKLLAIQTAGVLENGSGTNIFDGLRTGLTVGDNIEAVYLLSDGEPSVGVTDPQEILQRITRENRFRRISVNSIAVGRDSPLMRELAKRNRGSYRISQ